MKISIITACFNSHDYIQQCLTSVQSQNHQNIEHIIIDGGSTDGTLRIIEQNRSRDSIVVSERDDGIYHALNKGISLATGDIIGFLHSDDLYNDQNVITDVCDEFVKSDPDSLFGDLIYVSRQNHNKVLRYWKSGEFRKGSFKWGWMPPHPTFFVKKEVYNKYGDFDTRLRIAADYEIMLRFLEKIKISTSYIPKTLVKMRIGGESNRNLKNIFLKSREDFRAWRINGLRCNFYTIFLKNILKLEQFIHFGGNNYESE
ncbi:MAG: glycosyltransferase family 2 protein [Candidatus Wallbacteria bacterium]|nr:glycosyltransferase family 2 protein [Candidatus Wallbacteria bacterium]